MKCEDGYLQEDGSCILVRRDVPVSTLQCKRSFSESMHKDELGSCYEFERTGPMSRQLFRSSTACDASRDSFLKTTERVCGDGISGWEEKKGSYIRTERTEMVLGCKKKEDVLAHECKPRWNESLCLSASPFCEWKGGKEEVVGIDERSCEEAEGEWRTTGEGVKGSGVCVIPACRPHKGSQH